jgi:hypothetical protein
MAIPWSTVAEGLGVLSGVLLMFPAVALNIHLRAIKTSQDQLAQAATALSKAIAGEAKVTLEKAAIPVWSDRDENLLLLGILAFVLSSAIKLGIAFNAPEPAGAGAAPAAEAAASVPAR